MPEHVAPYQEPHLVHEATLRERDTAAAVSRFDFGGLLTYMKDHIMKIREAFSGERFVNESLGAVIEAASKGYAKCTMAIESRHCNSFGILMGGAIFTLADFAFAVAANQDGKAVVSQAVQITFLTPAVGKTLIAEAGIIREGGKTSFYSVVVTDELGTEVAFATANGYLVSEE